ncbi:MAG TPA: hypothetical protein DD719_02385 [Desulfotomaculum sp.]|nr:hypothetical protein [Desulfotomaculum sp.]
MTALVRIILVFFILTIWAGWKPSLLSAWAGCYPTTIQAVLPENGKVSPIAPKLPPGKVVIVVVDGISISDLQLETLPVFNKLIRQGALGLMNGNTAKNINAENAYATIGAGSRILAPNAQAGGFNGWEKVNGLLAKDSYRQRTGKMPPDKALVQLEIASIQQVNSELSYPALPGILGTVLREAGLRTAVLGNADTLTDLGRQAVTIAMDNNGLVDYGEVSTNLLALDKDFLNSLRTDYSKLLQAFDRLPPDTALFVIETGDLSRLKKEEPKALANVLQNQHYQALRRIDTFLGHLIKRLDFQRDLLFIISPTVESGTTTKGLETKNCLAPVLVAGAGVKAGLLISPSTRRPGLILNIDLAPTIIHYYGLSVPWQIIGRPMQVSQTSKKLPDLQKMQQQLILTYDARPLLLKGYIFFQLILLILSLYSIFGRKKGMGKILKPFLIAVLAVPLVFLVLPLLPQPTITVLIIEFFGLTFFITGLAWLLAHRLKPGFGQAGCLPSKPGLLLNPFLFLALANAILILADTLSGAPLQKVALLSYDPIGGARFYGIGNEYMGVLIGAVILSATTMLTTFRFRKIFLTISGLLFLGTIFTLVAPNLGTNLGGAIAATVAFMFTFLILAGFQLNWKTGSFIAICLAALILFAFLFDLYRSPETQSHLGRSANLFLTGGWIEIKGVIFRKIAMNIKLIKYTIWSRIFLASLVTLAILFYRPVGLMASVKLKYPFLYQGFIGIIVGSIAAFIFNDSGIVAAATTSIFINSPLVYLMLQEEQ